MTRTIDCNKCSIFKDNNCDVSLDNSGKCCACECHARRN